MYLVHNYTQCLIGSPCCSVSYYNCISVWPYYTILRIIYSYVSLISEYYNDSYKQCERCRICLDAEDERLAFQAECYNNSFKNTHHLQEDYKTWCSAPRGVIPGIHTLQSFSIHLSKKYSFEIAVKHITIIHKHEVSLQVAYQ